MFYINSIFPSFFKAEMFKKVIIPNLTNYVFSIYKNGIYKNIQKYFTNVCVDDIQSSTLI